MTRTEKELREALGLRMDTPRERSSRLVSALYFLESYREGKLPWAITTTGDAGWAGRNVRTMEGVVDSRIIGVNRRTGGNWEFVIIYTYTRRRCVKCGKLTKWGKDNPYAAVCPACK